MLTLTAALLATSATAQVSQDNEKADSVGQAPSAPAASARTFNIPPQPLETAVTAFGRQAGVQVSIETSVARGIQTGGVSGTMTASQALNQLLAGTGIVARFISDREIILTSAQGSGPADAMQLDPVQVQGYVVPSQAMIDNLPPPYAGGQVATGGQLGLLGNRDVMDTPFNQTNYTAKKAQDQQAKTARDVLVDDPSVRAISSTVGSAAAEAVNIRGFPADGLSVFSYGGLYGILPSRTVMAELAERVEVLKGPSAMLNGMQPDGAIGGTLNIVPKRAPDAPLTQLTASYASSGQFGGHADVARRFGAEGQFGVRFNGAFKAGQTDVRWNSDQRALAVLGLDFRGERARFSADLGYQNQNIGGVVSYLGVEDGVPLPWAPHARSNPAGQPWSNLNVKDLFGVFRGEVDLTERITAYAAFGAHDNRTALLGTFGVTITNPYGAASGANPYSYSEYDTFRTAEAGLRARVDTGPIEHQVAFTATTFEAESGVGANNSGVPFATNIYNPTIIARPDIVTPVANKSSTSTLSSLGFADTLSAADKRIQLTVGARLQRVAAANFDPASGAQTSTYDQSALSPSVSLVFKPWQDVSVYGNWIQGLQRGRIVGPQYQNAGEVFPPFKSTQYEVGVKVDWGKFTTTASAFQISKPNAIAVAGPLLPTLELNGEQRNQGLELNVFGEPIDGVRLLGGVMFLNGVLTKTQGGLTDGWVAPSAPAVQANLSGEWDLPFARGLTVNGRVIYTSSQYFDTTYPRRSLPDWTRFDLGARYTFDNPGAKGKLLVARFNVENVLDANYWQGGENSFVLFLGAPRTFRLSLTADF